MEEVSSLDQVFPFASLEVAVFVGNDVDDLNLNPTDLFRESLQKGVEEHFLILVFQTDSVFD